MSNYSQKGLLNIGCGEVVNPDWINIDMNGGPNVFNIDISSGLPFADECFEVVYHSHLLEHLSKQEAEFFMSECYRVLKPGGLLRVLVPDLEQIVKLYLEQLAAAEYDSTGYDWITLELMDQMVRGRSGGEMELFLRNNPNISGFVAGRLGAMADHYLKPKTSSILHTELSLKWLVKASAIKIHCLLLRLIFYLFSGRKTLAAFDEGLFRHSGEVHRWMYDRFSLNRLLKSAGFCDIRIETPETSRIVDFISYGLDVANGTVRKPDSLVMEAVKP